MNGFCIINANILMNCYSISYNDYVKRRMQFRHSILIENFDKKITQMKLVKSSS